MHQEKNMTHTSDSSKTAGKKITVKLLVDAQSFAYLKGAEIDYRKDIQGERFIIRSNPNIKTTCGCGSSFTVEQ